MPDLVDSERVPEAVWSVNLFGSAQVAAIGRDRLLGAEWHVARELPCGGVVATVTDQRAAMADEILAKRIARIMRQLDLPSLQRAQPGSSLAEFRP